MTVRLRPSWLEVDLDAARHNLRVVRELVGPQRTLFAVVKADGYGLGAAAMGRAFLEAGADALGVADAGEAGCDEAGSRRRSWCTRRAFRRPSERSWPIDSPPR